MKRASSHSLWLISLLIFSLSGCFEKDDENVSPLVASQQDVANTFFSDTVTDFTVRVYYEDGAAPYVGALGGNDTWDVTQDSFTALFQNHPGRTVNVPSALSSMTKIFNQNEISWSSGELIELAANLNHDFKSATSVKPAVVFIKGYFAGSADVLGVHLTGIPIAFIFKNAITAVGGNATQQRYIEQAVVVHEVGHAVGLVNYGVPMVTGHDDNAHPSHSNNPLCVMNWRTDSAAGVLAQIAPYVAGNQLVLFGPESLQDGRAYHP